MFHPTARDSILEALTTRLNIETDPTLRRAVHESIYDVLDENTGYLDAWIRTAATDEDASRIRKGYETVVHDQAQILARVLRSATPQGRQGILESLWDFHIRHYSLPKLSADQVSVALPAVFVKYVSGVPDLHVPGYEYPPYRDTADFKYDVHNGFYQTRIGNDSDLIHFFKSSGPELEAALVDCLRGASDDLKIDVLKAGSVLSGAGGPLLPTPPFSSRSIPIKKFAKPSTMSTKTVNAASSTSTLPPLRIRRSCAPLRKFFQAIILALRTPFFRCLLPCPPPRLGSVNPRLSHRCTRFWCASLASPITLRC